MVKESDSSECFARETFADDEPSHGWNQIQLEQYAQTQHDTIVRGETTLAPAYYRLGRSLEMLRRIQFSWANTLIDPTSIDFRILDNQDKVDLVDTTFPSGRNDALQWNIKSRRHATA